MTVPSHEGEAPFEVPEIGVSARTWYKVYGDIKQSKKTPLLILHGGPGACHEYLLEHAWLSEKHGIPTIFYDQIGNGRSTHLRDKAGDESFWTEELFRRELDNLVDHLALREGRGSGEGGSGGGFDLLGHSWGGMLAAAYATYRPRGLRRVILHSAPADSRDWQEAQEGLRERLPPDVRDTLRRCDEKGDTESKEFEEAMNYFYSRHLCKLKPWPCPEIAVALGHMSGDSTVYGTMNGPTEIHQTGSLKSWQIKDRLHLVEIPTLLINGSDDEAQDSTMMPFFLGIKKVKWYTIDGASHMSHVENKDKHMSIVSSFLLERNL